MLSKKQKDAVLKICDHILKTSYDTDQYLIDNPYDDTYDIHSIQNLSEIFGCVLALKAILETLETGDYVCS